jgi:glycine cleavage system H lipoate-binding protein
MTAILVVLTIVFFLGVDWLVRRLRRETPEIAAVADNPAAGAYPLRMPEGIFFARSHTWLNLFPSGKVRLGVDDFVGSLMEAPEIVLLRKAGDRVERGDPLMELREGGRQLTVRAPLAGEILNVNDGLVSNPRAMQDALFSAGWAYTIQPRRLEELKDLMFGRDTREWMMSEFRRLRDWLADPASVNAPAAAYLQDGGLPRHGLIRQLSPASVRRLQQEFLEVL